MGLVRRFDTPGSLRDAPAGSRFYDEWHRIIGRLIARSTGLSGPGAYVDPSQVDEGALVNSIRAVHQGQSLIDPAAAVRVIERMRSDSAAPDGLSALTDIESQILDLITEGRTNKQIGEQLYLAEKTVKNHVTSLLAKLGVQRRTQAAVLASQLGRKRPG